MIISPPFLPSRGANETDEDYLSRAMVGGGVDHGAFPASHNLAWHGGVHLTAPVDGNSRLPVRAIADGTVVYRRTPTAMPSDATAADAHALGYNGWTDDGVVVIRHDTEIGANQQGQGTEVRFFSVYMHLNNVLVNQNQVIRRKAQIGRSGMFEGQANTLHFEIICDDANLERLLGRRTGVVTPGRDGRTDAIFGEMYFRLPSGTPIYANRPAAGVITVGSPIAPVYTFAEETFVGIRFATGNAYVTTYRADGSEVGAALNEPAAEYSLYRDAGAIVRHYRTAGAPLIPAHSAVYELLRFGRVLGPDALTPADTPHWRQINYPGGSGWVNLNATGIFKLSDADAPHWRNWWLIDDDTNTDSRADSQALIDVILRGVEVAGAELNDVQKHDPAAVASTRRLQRQEAYRRIRNAAVQTRLMHAICKFPTEWERGTVTARWDWLTKEPDPDNTAPLPRTILTNDDFPDFKRYVEALAFWEDAGTGIDANHWHFHPTRFIEHFRKCSWLSNGELERALSAAPAQGRARANVIRIPSNKILRKYLPSDSNLRIAHFLAQVGHETGWWQFREEQGGPRYFRTMYEIITQQEAVEDFRSGLAQRLGQVRRGETEQQYSARRPGAVLAKAATMDNGAANANAGGQAGDGPRFRGRGFLQITGRRNYTSYSNYRGHNFTVEPNPSLLATNDYNACDASGFYWARENINREASEGSTQNNVTRVGGIINRGRADRVPLHNNDRITAFNSIWGILNDTP